MIRNRAALIDALASSSRPIRRARPAALRAAAWLAVSALIGAALVRLHYIPGALAARLATPLAPVELAVTLLAGIAAIVSAFRLGTPGLTGRWRLAAPALLGAWALVTAASLMLPGAEGGSIRASMSCFRFVLLASAPMAIAVVAALRRTRSLQPWRTAALAGVGVAALAAFLLAFCHPFALNPKDAAMHLAAVLIVVALVTLAGGPALRIRTGP